jgi:hypothetical protein
MMAFFLEVMDKEPWIWDIWLICVPLAFAGFFLCRKRVRFLWVILLLAILLLFYALPEIASPDLRNAILLEAGKSYYLIRVLALLFVILLSTIGAILNVKNQRNSA